MTKPTEAEKLARRTAAKERVKGWFDKPEHRPTKDDDERTRTGDITDPALQKKEPKP